MKYAIVIPDGAADEPQESLGGKTPLEAANTPAMDAIAETGMVGDANHVPDDLPAGSAVANMSLLGYDPAVAFTGRAPIEAAAQGIVLGESDWAIRCNLVTIQDQVMCDFTAGHISTSESSSLLQTLSEQRLEDEIRWISGVSYRNLLVCRGESRAWPFDSDTRTTPPHDLTDLKVINHYPRGAGSDLLNKWMRESVSLFHNHPINKQRIANGNRPATNVWLWGQGRRPHLQLFADKFQRQGVMITAVDLLRGLAELIGWRNVHVPGATGYTDTDYSAKGRAAIDTLQSTDLVCVHIEAPDEASHEGDLAKKIEAIEAIDQKIVAPLYDFLRVTKDFRILICPDHPTPVRTKTHSHGRVPFTMAGSGIPSDEIIAYNEISAESSNVHLSSGHTLMERFIC